MEEPCKGCATCALFGLSSQVSTGVVPAKCAGTQHRAKLARQRRAEENERIIRRAKDIPCADCGQRFAPSQMDFDHVRGIKEFNIGDAKRKVGSERLEAEITKCDVVCAVCHRIRTRRRRRGQDETV